MVTDTKLWQQLDGIDVDSVGLYLAIFEIREDKMEYERWFYR